MKREKKLHRIRLSGRMQSLLLFLFVSLLMVVAAPRSRKFVYQFVEGKPWQYDLLTAPNSFPIYKRSNVLQAEKDSVRHAINPYCFVEPSVGIDMQRRFDEEYAMHHSSRLPDSYHAYVSEQLKRYYESGLIDEELLRRLRSDGRLEVNLLHPDKSAVPVPITQFYTLKEAYALLLQNKPDDLKLEYLKDLNVSNFLQSNVVYNESTTEKIIQEAVSHISLSTGVVQKDERIIDRGQIVDTHTYDVLTSYKKEYEEQSGGIQRQLVISLSLFVLIAVLMLCLWAFTNLYNTKYFTSIRNSVFITMLMLIVVLFTELSVRTQLFSVYVIPYAIVPLMIRIFFDSRTALFSHVVTILIAAMFVALPFEFIFLQTVAGVVVVFSLRKLSSRGQLIRATFRVFLSYVVLTLFISLMQNGTLENEDFVAMLFFGVNLIFLMFSYLLVYVLERLFGYTSNISLVELSDINTPLLRKLSEVAPGTFQHSMQMSILASEAATAIGADSQLTRTGALYHDIGKMLNPSYFTENQGKINPHDALSHKESAAVIIKHVTDGVALAKQHRIPPSVIDFIRTHHGRGTTRYFYTLYCNEHPNELVDPAPFTYPGPNPFTKETAILMLADAVEASSRSLTEYSVETLQNHVGKIIDSIVSAGYINNSPLTFQDVTTIKNVFAEKLVTMYHSRIAYPQMHNPQIEAAQQ